MYSLVIALNDYLTLFVILSRAAPHLFRMLLKSKSWPAIQQIVTLVNADIMEQSKRTRPGISVSPVPSPFANAGIVKQINVFTVPEGGQPALIDFLKEAAKFASSTPGWLSASVCSRDGTRVVNYAQSKDLEAAERIIECLGIHARKNRPSEFPVRSLKKGRTGFGAAIVV